MLIVRSLEAPPAAINANVYM